MAYNTTDTGLHGFSGPFIGDPVDPAGRVVFIVIGVLMILSAVIGNTSLIVIVFKLFLRSHKRQLHDLFITNLALGDLLTIGYWFAFFVLDLILGFHPVANMSHCIANGMIISILSLANVAFLVSISFNRYLLVCYTHLYHRVFTFPRTVRWCLLVWFLSILSAYPPIWGGAAGSYLYNARSHICSSDPEGISYPTVMIGVFSTLPLFGVIYFNTSIFRFWKGGRMSLTSRYPPELEQQKTTKAKFLAAKWRAVLKKPKALPGTRNEELAQTDEVELVLQNRAVLEVQSHEVADLSEEEMNNTHGTTTIACLLDTESEERHRDPSESKPLNTSATSPAALASTAAATASMTSTLPPTSTSATEMPTSSAEVTPTTPPSASVPRKTRSVESKCRKEQQQVTSSGELRKEQHAREVAFVRSLLVVCALMFMAFVPLSIVVVIEACCTKVPQLFVMGSNSLLFLNNAINWIVYGIMNPKFRKIYVTGVRRCIDACLYRSKQN